MIKEMKDRIVATGEEDILKSFLFFKGFIFAEHMNSKEKLTQKLIEILAKKDASPEEKKAQALIKSALLCDNVLTFINEFRAAFKGIGKIRRETVKGLTEYVRVYNEAQIRKTYNSNSGVETLLEKENERLTEVEVWVLGTLAYWGLLEG